MISWMIFLWCIVISTCAGHVLRAYHEQKQLRPQNVQVRSMSLSFLYWTAWLDTGATCCGFTYSTQNHNKRQKQAALFSDQQSLNQQTQWPRALYIRYVLLKFHVGVEQWPHGMRTVSSSFVYMTAVGFVTLISCPLVRVKSCFSHPHPVRWHGQ